MRTLRPLTMHTRPGYRVGRLACLSSLLVLLAACGSDATAPELSSTDVAGVYQATTFIVTAGGSTRDVLAEGGLLDVSLSLDGTTTGHLFVPGGNTDGSDLDVALDGTWTLTGNTVRFTQTEDTLVRDLAFTADGQTLQTDSAIQTGIRVQITLSRPPNVS